ncbi:hypothetical protein BU23DRAFT_461772 [Bimuria novae-zelandiae CBS 107.79]|uniref:Uncharacterized protein n=1 Tax=Bimuria novae-zelandiae CBS 107.79 TaxID=1447943 RepID=A0A6A5VCC3_9PLEO|nr:hypothetical protein BU23DRAFT_461772 [Bimuria novae-zelandiae CBS 107.79]
MHDGKRLRQIRLRGLNDPDPHLNKNEVYSLELWRRIVEVYSKTAITKSEDKLIALSGIAKLMADKIGGSGSPAEYVAGLWKNQLASQLLWKVDPDFDRLTKVFTTQTTAPESYRAPSFSWASINTETGKGITTAEVTDTDLLLRVDDVHITLETEGNPYGMVKSGRLSIWGKLRAAVLYKKPRGCFGWKLVGRGDLDGEVHTNVYLDCPERDETRIFASDGSANDDAGIFIVPVAKGERTASEESKYLTCLILQLERTDPSNELRRIGLTRLSPWADKIAMQDYKILDVSEGDQFMPHNGYEAGLHRITLV